MAAFVGNDVVVGGNSESANSSVAVAAIEGNPVAGQLVGDHAVVLIVVVHAEFDGLPRETHVEDGLRAVILDLNATEIADIANGPAIVAAVATVASLVAEDHSLSSRHDFD